MIPDELKTPQLFFKTDGGEYKPIDECSIEQQETDDIQDEYVTKYYPREMTAKMKKKDVRKLFQALCPKYLCNNWRKMHGLPLIRRMRKRK